MKKPVHQLKNSKKKGEWLAPWQFKPGQSGNLKGRTPGKSMKEFAKEYLSKMTEEERLKYFEGMNKVEVWKMAEGNPKSDVDLSGEITSKIISVDE
jgi:hypothetical protein